MTGKEFLNSLANDKSDTLQRLITILKDTGSRYCVIGGLAVNAYVKPVVSLDVDIVVAVADIKTVLKAAEKHGMTVAHFEHSVNLHSPGSDLRIQIQTDPRYQDFIPGAKIRTILGYPMNVAGLEDILRGKIWAFTDTTRRKSKRQKDLADIWRLMEAFPELESRLPRELKDRLQEI